MFEVSVEKNFIDYGDVLLPDTVMLKCKNCATLHSLTPLKSGEVKEGDEYTNLKNQISATEKQLSDTQNKISAHDITEEEAIAYSKTASKLRKNLTLLRGRKKSFE